MSHLEDPEYLALLETVRTFPRDDAPRGIIADWLDDAGLSRYAELIRVQLKIASLGFDAKPMIRVDNPINGPVDLVAQERDHWGSWPDEDDARTAIHEALPASCGFVVLPDSMVGGNPWTLEPLAIVRRGFVDEVRFCLANFKRYAASLFSSHPITSVVLNGVRPLRYSNGPYPVVGFVCDESPESRVHDMSHVLPVEIWALLLRRSESVNGGVLRLESVEWEQLVSWACVEYGRSLVGLPPLNA